MTLAERIERMDRSLTALELAAVTAIRLIQET